MESARAFSYAVDANQMETGWMASHQARRCGLAIGTPCIFGSIDRGQRLVQMVATLKIRACEDTRPPDGYEGGLLTSREPGGSLGA